MLCRWPFHQPASRLRLALTRVVDRQGQLVYEYCKSSHWQVEFMLCAICRSTFTRQFSRVLTPGPTSLDFSRESPAKDMWCYVAYVYNGELVSLIGNQRVGIFPPKSKILFHLSLALKWYQNFQDWAFPVGGDTWPLLKKGNLFPSWKISELEFSHQNQKNLFSLRISFIWYRKIQDWPSPLGGVTWPKYAECWPVRRKEGIIIGRTRETYASWHMRSRSRKPREQIRRTVTRRFNQNGEILKKVAERSGNSG